MISVKNISKNFNKNKNEKIIALNNVSLTAKDGTILGILGPNGAGKTTLLRILVGIMKESTGEVYFDEIKVNENNYIKIRKQIAFLSGNTKLYKDITPYELLNMCGRYYDIEKNELESRIREIIKRFNMQGFINQRIGTLSSGQMQKVNVARCLVHNPKYYILDEATNALDVISSQVIIDFIKSEKKKGKCILYSTHYMEEAENICDEIVLYQYLFFSSHIFTILYWMITMLIIIILVLIMSLIM